MGASDSFISVWTIGWWVLAGVVGVVGVLLIVLAFAGPDKRRETRVPILSLATVAIIASAVLFGVGDFAKGSIADRDLRAAKTAEAKAMRDLQHLNYEQCGRPVCAGGAFGH